MSGPQRIPYTEFQDQFAGENVAEMFARGNTIEGELKKPAAARTSGRGAVK
jgi:hypothetical protein